MRIAFLCSEYPPEKHGGIGTFTKMMAQELMRRGHTIRVAGIYGSDSAARCEEIEGVQVWKIPASPWRGAWPVARRKLYRLMAEWAQRDEIDLIEAPDYEGPVALWPALDVPVVVRLHGSATYFCQETGRRAPAQTRFVESFGLRRADFCCSVSAYTARRTAETVHEGLKVDEVLYNGVEAATTEERLRSRTKIIFTGTLIPKKGIFELAAAWPLVQQAVPEAELHLYGRDGRAPDGGMSSDWLANHLSPFWNRTVHYHGFAERSTIFDALSTARAAVFPSLSEAFAIAPLESMARGCPTIYSGLSSGPELVTHNESGLLVDPRSPEDLAAAMIRILTDEALAEKLSREGRRHVETNFMAGQWADRNEQFYSRCVQDFRTRRLAVRGTPVGNASCHE